MPEELENLKEGTRKMLMANFIVLVALILLLPVIGYYYDRDQRVETCQARAQIQRDLADVQNAADLAITAAIEGRQRQLPLLDGAEKQVTERNIAEFEAALAVLGPITVEDCD